MASHYDVLGIPRSAGTEVIRRAYHQQARAWHPDRFVSRPSAEADKAEDAMRDVNEAFRVLGNAERRRDYDNELIHGGLGNGHVGTGRVSTDDGVTRIDPRLLDPEVLARRRQRQEEALSAHHSRMMNVIPWIGFLGILAAIFIFTAYATRPASVEPIPFPGPDIGVAANSCVRLMQGGSLTEVPCDRVNDGRVIGARFPDGVCPAFTNREISLSNDRVVCLQ